MSNLLYKILTKTVGLSLNLLAIFNPKKAAKIAYGLHSQPRIGQISENKIPQILKSSVQKILAIDELKYQTYSWIGNHETILLMHGWESNSARWERLLPYLLETKKTVIAIDAPAHGLSSDSSFSVPKYAKLINEFAKTTKIDYIISHSIGGAAAVFYQFKYQNPDLKKMVILGAPSDLQVLINNFTKLMGFSKQLKKHLETEFSKNTNLPISEFSTEKFGSKIKIPALIAHDQNDTVVAFSESQKTIKNWKNITFIETKNLGHSMHDDVLYQQIIGFLKL